MKSGLLIHAFLSWRCAATQARLASTRKERDEAFVLARRSHQACDAKLDAMRLRLLKERRSRRLADTRAALACLQVLASLGQLSFGATTPELAALCFCAWQLSVSQAAQGHALQNRIGEAGVRSFDEPKRHNLRMSVDQISRDHNAKWHLCRLSGMPSPAHLCFAVWRLWSSCRFRCEKLSGRITQRLQAGVKRLWLQRWQNALCQLRLFRSTSGAFLRRCFRYWADMARQTHWKRSGKLREPEERRAKETLCALLLLSFRGLHMNAQVQRAERECMTCDVDDRSTARQQAVKPTYATKAVGGEDDEGSQVELYGRKQTTVGFGMKPQPIARPSGFLLPDLHLLWVAFQAMKIFPRWPSVGLSSSKAWGRGGRGISCCCNDCAPGELVEDPTRAKDSAELLEDAFAAQKAAKMGGKILAGAQNAAGVVLDALQDDVSEETPVDQGRSKTGDAAGGAWVQLQSYMHHSHITVKMVGQTCSTGQQPQNNQTKDAK
eukprot:g10714.t1